MLKLCMNFILKELQESFKDCHLQQRKTTEWNREVRRNTKLKEEIKKDKKVKENRE
jgi:hypothetical protein